jgi:phosphate transport system protein
MAKHFERQIARLKDQIVALGNLVENGVCSAIQAFIEHNSALAEEVIEGDRKIDRLEVDMEEECLKILALYQPVAIDLRFIIAVLKMNNDLERIGDLAANIARRVEEMEEKQSIEVPPEVHTMSKKVKEMLQEALSSLIYMKAGTAHGVMAADKEVNDLHHFMFKWATAELNKNPAAAEEIVRILSVSRHLERIADLASNIAEDVVYMLDGEIVRHGRKRFDSDEIASANSQAANRVVDFAPKGSRKQ